MTDQTDPSSKLWHQPSLQSLWYGLPSMHCGILLQPPRQNYRQSVVSLQWIHLLVHLKRNSRSAPDLIFSPMSGKPPEIKNIPDTDYTDEVQNASYTTCPTDDQPIVTGDCCCQCEMSYSSLKTFQECNLRVWLWLLTKSETKYTCLFVQSTILTSLFYS